MFVVEDEAVVAMDLVQTLQRLGYDVAGTAATGEAALEGIAAEHPDLVLLDIRLDGDMDGVEVAERLRAKHGPPVVFLTAYSDDQTLARAKVTAPYGYVVKPFEERELGVMIAIALHKAGLERRLFNEQQRLASVLGAMSDALVQVDATGRVEFLNAAAERLLATTADEGVGRPMGSLGILETADGVRWETALWRVLSTGERAAFGDDATFTPARGATGPVTARVEPLVSPDGSRAGALFVITDATAVERIAALEGEVTELKRRLLERVRELV